MSNRPSQSRNKPNLRSNSKQVLSQSQVPAITHIYQPPNNPLSQCLSCQVHCTKLKKWSQEAACMKAKYRKLAIRYKTEHNENKELRNQIQALRALLVLYDQNRTTNLIRQTERDRVQFVLNVYTEQDREGLVQTEQIMVENEQNTAVRDIQSVPKEQPKIILTARSSGQHHEDLNSSRHSISNIRKSQSQKQLYDAAGPERD